MSDILQARRALRMRLHRDCLYVDAADFAAQMANVGNVALLREGDDLWILPIFSAEAGGFLVKQVNARGDRAIHAADLFRLNGVDENRDIRLDAAWSDARAGFLASAFFAD
ncbi:hypothetical protein RZS28_05145 [Methylocapsa polymorpha]|uniref:Uncharacterized protein n=1 Tax=Methylocapsa polymorpha TaxID=3080828 RepID=A0ABZ0HV29_9HYPH|nr:hypothetical protein RZS28_05145 [Methylocapsa sp. RX1]